MKLREGGRVVSMAVIVAVAVNSDGRREILGITVMPSEAETFFPNREAVVRLVGALMLEQNDECAVSRRYMPVEKLTGLCDDRPGGSIIVRVRMAQFIGRPNLDDAKHGFHERGLAPRRSGVT